MGQRPSAVIVEAPGERGTLRQMSQTLRVLVIDDSDADTQLVLTELERGGFTPVYARVNNAETFNEALRQDSWQLILSEYALPQLRAVDALATTRVLGLDTPFLVVSRDGSQEAVIDAMRAGVQDYIRKENFARLLPAVERELREVALLRERINMQDQLMLTDRMASVGMLAAGVAHDINNPLAALIANLDYVVQEIDEQVRAGADLPPLIFATRAALSDALISSDRIREIVRDVRIFAVHNDERPASLNVQEVLESSLRLALNEVRHRANVVKDFADVPNVWGNEARLSQAFLNLIVNASLSMPENRAEANEIRLVTRTDKAGRAVIEVRDTGRGISHDMLESVFRPYFATRSRGAGSGIGLSMAQQIIASFEGTIAVDSQVGLGTQFTVTLPPAAPDLQPQARKLVSDDMTIRRGRILVVDDEQGICKAVRRVLTADHDVEIATSARTALERLTAGERFDVILCDVMMPEMSGIDLHSELTRVAPDQAERMTFTTGGIFTARANDFFDNQDIRVIEKPFDLQKLRSYVRSVVEEGRPVTP